MEDKTIVQIFSFIILGVVAVYMLYQNNEKAFYAVGALAFLMLPSPLSEKIIEMIPVSIFKKQ